MTQAFVTFLRVACAATRAPASNDSRRSGRAKEREPGAVSAIS